MENINAVNSLSFLSTSSLKSTKKSAQSLDFNNILSEKTSSVKSNSNDLKKETIKDNDNNKSNDDVEKPISKYQNKNAQNVKNKEAKVSDDKQVESKDNVKSGSKVNKSHQSLKEKISRIKELLDDPATLTDQSKQDELMKLVLQIQGLMENKSIDLKSLDKSTLEEFSKLFNNNIIEQLSQTDSLLKQVTSEIQKDINNLLGTNTNDINSNCNNINNNGISNINYKSSVNDSDTNLTEKIDQSNDKNSKLVANSATDNSDKKVEAKLQPANNIETKNTENLVIQKIEQNKDSFSSVDNTNVKNNDNIKFEQKLTSVLTAGSEKNIQHTVDAVKELLGIIENDATSGDKQNSKDIVNTNDVKSELKEAVLKTVQTVEFKSGSKAPNVNIQSSLEKGSNNILFVNSNQQLNVNDNNFKNVILKNTLNNNAAVNYKDVIEQVTNSTKIVATEDGVNEMVIKLNPENLGKLSLKLITENGIIRADFVAESQKVKEIIEANFNQLKESFSNQGLNIGNLSVSVNSGDSSFREQMFNQGNNKRKFKSDENTLQDDSYGIREIGSTEIENEYIHPQSSVEFMA